MPSGVVQPPPLARPAFADDVDALIREARRRQRKRRLLAALVATVAVAAVGAAVYRFTHVGAQSPGTNLATPVCCSSVLRLHLRGFGTPLPIAVDSGPCPQGRTLITIAFSALRGGGSVLSCVLTITQHERRTYGVERIVQTVLETYRLPAGSIVARETQTFRFARDQRHTTASFHGRIVGGSGRYANAHGTVSGGGPGVDGKAVWAVSLRLR